MFSFINQPESDRTFIFRANDDTVSSFQAWSKPSGISFIYILSIGGGGPGGAGQSGASGTLRNGGGGGGSGGITTALFPAFLLPDTLYVYVGGSQRGSMVTLDPSTNFPIVVATAGSGGTAGSSGGGAGGGGPVRATSNHPLASMGIFSFIVGQNGTVGATTSTAATTVSAHSALFITGGGGGGCVDAANATGAGGGIAPGTASLFGRLEVESLLELLAFLVDLVF